MKKAVRISVYSLVLLAVIFFLLPYAINLKPVQKQLEKRLCNRLNIRADVGKMAWHWFPGPRVSLYDVNLSHQQFDASFPYGAVCPDLVGLIRWRTVVKLILDRPEIDVKTLCHPGALEGTCETEKSPPLTSVFLNIKKGHLVLPSDGWLESLAKQGPRTEISGIDADVAMFENGFDIKSVFGLSFAKKITSHVSVKEKRQKKTGKRKDYWQLDISGEDLDLTAAREKVLLLFGEHRVAQKVCDIVRGGRAKSGRYIFNGYVEDFRNLDAMRISALADDVDIRVPKVELPLAHGTGPIVIKNGILTGEKLSARLGNSIGRNGSILLDLHPHLRKRPFRLDADVDAAVAELPGWLMNNLLVHHEAVVKELHNITRAQGRATGRLHIGDTLPHPVVKAEVSDSDSLVAYQRFDNPVQIKQGVITVFPGKLTWAQVNGQIGPQIIDDSRGTVSWKEGIRLDVDKIDARLEAGPLLKEITVRLGMVDRLAALIDDVDGSIKVKNLKAHGPVNDIKKMTYEFTAATDDLTIDGSLLPDKMRMHTSGVFISNNRIVLPPSRIDMTGRQMKLEANLSHTLWKNFSGSLKVWGVIGQRVARWIKAKAWMPPRFFPSIPCLLEPLTISWDKTAVSLKGKIVPGRGDADNGVSTILDLTVSKDRIDMKKLTIASLDETADLWFCIDRGQHPGMKAGFSGSLKKETMDVILENNDFLTGAVSGDCELEYNCDHKSAHRMTGNLDVSWAVLFFKDNRIVINKAAVDGDGACIKIKRADLKINDESIMADGRIYFPDNADLKTELNVKSGELSVRNLQHLFGDLKKAFVRTGSAQSPLSESVPPPESQPVHGFSATGIINFDVKKFLYNPEKTGAGTPVKQFTGQDMSGTISLAPDNRVAATILSGKVCGLEVSGLVGLPPETTALSFRSRSGPKPRVQPLLDCLGIKDREISGKFVLDASIEGTPDNWTGGFIEFRAEKGKMKGLAVISKILTLLNVTELFSINVFKNFFTLGYPYSDMKISGKIENNILTIDETKIIGEGMDIFFKGTVNLKTTALDMVAYVKPFKMVDSIVTLIPYVGKNLGDGEKSIAFIPFKIKGTVDNPDVYLIFEDKSKQGE